MSPCVVCGEMVSTVMCPQLTEGPICRVCHSAKRLAFRCPCMTVAEALVINETESDPGAAKRALTTIAKLLTPEGTPTMKPKKTKPKSNGSSSAKSSPGDDNPVERARYDDRLPCKLDPVDLPARAYELAKVTHDLEETRERKRESNAKYRERITFLQERANELAESVEGKTELRSVEVVEYLLPRTNTVRIVRSDTGEIVEEHAATPEDLQEGLFGGAKGDDEKDEALAPE